MTATTVPIRPAATVMLVRDGEEGLEVLMLRRTLAAVFLAGAYVFPGGALDPGDDGYRAAAIRECFEEAGILLAVDGAGRPVECADRFAAHRRAVHAGEVSMAEVCATEGVTLDIGALQYVSRWVTPPGGPRRFDTRFYVAAAPAGQEPIHDEAEAMAIEWLRPVVALERSAAGTIDLIEPTVESLRTLVPFQRVADVFAQREACHG